MITLLRQSTLPAALAVVLGLLGSSARADFIIESGTNGGALTQQLLVIGSPTQSGGVSGSVSFSVGGYTITLLGGSETQGSPLSQLLSTNLSVVNNTLGNTNTLNLVIIGTGFTAPVTPPPVALSSSLGGSAGPISGASDTLSFNTLVANTSYGVGSYTFPTTGGTENYTASPTINTTIGSLTGTYSVEQDVNIHLTGKTGTGDTIGFNANTNLQSVVPEPSTMAIAGLGALGMIGYGLRRRKSA